MEVDLMKISSLKRNNKLLSLLLAIVVIVTCIPNISVFAEANENTRSVDQMLLKSQEWLNDNYLGKTGFVEVPEDGTSRRSTVNGCIRALQIELGITATADNFGTGNPMCFMDKRLFNRSQYNL